MAAPHTRQTARPQAPPRPTPAPSPPEQQPGPSRRRMIAGIIILAVGGGLVVWSLLSSGGGAIELDPDRPEASTDPPADTNSDTPPADDGVDAQLAELRASDRYLAIAPHDRAAGLEWPPGMDGAWESFQWFRTYSNQEVLWDEVVEPIRDDALLAGEPYTEPIWDEQHPVPAYVPNGWTNDTTEGRGDAYTFAVRFLRADGEPVERWHAVLIGTDAEGAGEVVARMQPFDLRREDAPDFPSAVEMAFERVWEWVQQQPVLDDEAAR